MREFLNDDINMPFSKEEERESLLKRLYEEEEWLIEGDGDSADFKSFNQKLSELNVNLTAIKNR